MAVLLSGFRVRLTDPSNAPLSTGRLSFFDATTSLPKAVYSSKSLSVSLGTEVNANLNGNLPDIWLSEGYYKILFQNLISTSPDVWDTYDTLNDVGDPTTGATSEPQKVYFANTMAEYRAIPSGTYGTCIVAGYYTAGDTGGAMMFRWDSASTKVDDGGAYIKHADQGSGAIGRGVQIFSGNVLDIRKWGGIPNGVLDCTAAKIACENYASDGSVFPMYPPTVSFGGLVTTGQLRFAFGNDIFLNAFGYGSLPIPYHVGDGVTFCAVDDLFPIRVTFENEVKIDTKQSLIFGSSTLFFTVGCTPFIRPQWEVEYGQNYLTLEQACSYGIPVLVENWGGINVPASTTTTFDSDVTLDSLTHFYGSSSGTIVFAKSFNLIDVDHWAFQDNINVRFYKTEPRTSWFGFGKLAGTDHSQAVQRAIDSVYYNHGRVICVNREQVSQGIYSAVTAKTQSWETPSIWFEAPIIVGNGGSFTDVLVQNGTSTKVFEITGTGSVTVANDSIHAGWFGALTQNNATAWNANDYSIPKAFNCAILSKKPLIGDTYYIGNPITSSIGSGLALDVKGLKLYGGSTYDIVSNPSCLLITGSGSSRLDECYLFAKLSNSCGKTEIYNMVTTASISISSPEYIVRDSKFTVFDDADCVFFSAYFKGEITGCTFNESISIYGDQTIYPVSSRVDRRLENIYISHNNFIGNTSKIDLVCRGTDTKVRGVYIHDNTFRGTSVAGSTRRITSTIAAGNFLASTQHTIVIKDNRLGFYDGSGSAPAHDWIPETEGSYTTELSFDATVVATHTPSDDRVFRLSGDTTSPYTKLLVTALPRAQQVTPVPLVYTARPWHVAIMATPDLGAPISFTMEDSTPALEHFVLVDYKVYGNYKQDNF